MGGLFFGLFMIPIVLVCGFGIPIIIGVLVYKDSIKRETNAWLWTFVAALVPSFIGVIIYLVMRNDFPLKTEFSGKEQNREKADNQAYEQTSYTTEGGDTYTTVTSSKPDGISKMAKILLIVFGAIALLFVIGVCLMIGYTVLGNGYYMM